MAHVATRARCGQCAPLASGIMATASYAQDVAATPVGRLSAWEVAKAHAFSVILADVSDNLDTPAAELLGQRVDEYIASKVTLKGGGHPDARALRKAIRVQSWDCSFCFVEGQKAATPCCMSANSWP